MFQFLSALQEIYRDFVGKSEYGDFKFMGIACIPAIPVIFDVNTLCGLLISTLNYDFLFKFPYNFCGDFRIPAIPVKFICILQGTPCDTGIPHTLYRGKICSVGHVILGAESLNSKYKDKNNDML